MAGAAETLIKTILVQIGRPASKHDADQQRLEEYTPKELNKFLESLDSEETGVANATKAHIWDLLEGETE